MAAAGPTDAADPASTEAGGEGGEGGEAAAGGESFSMLRQMASLMAENRKMASRLAVHENVQMDEASQKSNKGTNDKGETEGQLFDDILGPTIDGIESHEDGYMDKFMPKFRQNCEKMFRGQESNKLLGPSEASSAESTLPSIGSQKRGQVSPPLTKNSKSKATITTKQPPTKTQTASLDEECNQNTKTYTTATEGLDALIDCDDDSFTDLINEMFDKAPEPQENDMSRRRNSLSPTPTWNDHYQPYSNLHRDLIEDKDMHQDMHLFLQETLIEEDVPQQPTAYNEAVSLVQKLSNLIQGSVNDEDIRERISHQQSEIINLVLEARSFMGNREPIQNMLGRNIDEQREMAMEKGEIHLIKTKQLANSQVIASQNASNACTPISLIMSLLSVSSKFSLGKEDDNNSVRIATEESNLAVCLGKRLNSAMKEDGVDPCELDSSLKYIWKALGGAEDNYHEFGGKYCGAISLNQDWFARRDMYKQFFDVNFDSNAAMSKYLPTCL